MAGTDGATAGTPVELDVAGAERDGVAGDDATDDVRFDAGRYRGRRRRDDGLPGRVRAAGWLTLLGVALVVTLLLVAVPRLFTAPERRPSLLPPAPDTSTLTDGPTNGNAAPSVGPSTAATGSASPSRRPTPKPPTSAAAQPPPAAPSPSVNPTTSPPPPPPPPQTARYEAESAAIYHGVVQTNHLGYSGSGFVDTANEVGTYVQWTVTPTRAGSATLRVRFANGTTGGRPANVAVNGTVVASPIFAGTGNWDTWQTQTFTVTLNPGSNTVRVVAASPSGGPNIDYLEVVS